MMVEVNEKLIWVIERIANKKLRTIEKNEIYTFGKELKNNFNVVKKLIINSKLTRKNEKLSDFKLQYLEKIKFLNFIEDKIFPLNLRNLRELDVTKHLKKEEIYEIELCDRLYSLYTSLKEDLIENEKTENDGIKIINIQHLYNNFNNPFIKDQIVILNNKKKIEFNYWDLTKKYDLKDLAILNASRAVSAIDFFLNDKIFIYRKTKGSEFKKIKVRYREKGEIFSGELQFVEELKDLSTGWNIIITKKLRLIRNPYQLLNEKPIETKFIGHNDYNSILDNSHYSEKIFTKSSKYIPLEILEKERNEEFDNSFLVKILNYVQSFPITIDRWALKESQNINDKIYEEIENLKNDIIKEKVNTWKERKENNKNLKNIYNKIEGFINQIENNKEILRLLEEIGYKTFYINYFFCTRFRLYPNSGILNYQNIKILRIIFKGEMIGKQKIIETYNFFLEKHKNVKNKIIKNMFFYNKISSINCEKIINIVSNKIGRKIKILKWGDEGDMWDTILCNIAFHIIIRIGGTEKKISTYNNNDDIIVEGFKKIKNLENLNKNIYEKRLKQDWENFTDTCWIDQKLYSFDATTSMIQISSIICFAENEKILKQCGIIDPFKNSEKIEDAHETVLITVNKKIEKFIEEKNIEKYRIEIKNLLDRKFIKTIHIPFSYGQGERTLLQNVNKKQAYNKKWEKIPKKIKKILCNFVYNEILNIYKKDLTHILEARNAFEEAYEKSSISIGGEIIKMPVQTDISDVHIEYWELVKKRKSIIEAINNTKKDYEFYKEKTSELWGKIDNIDTRIMKIEDEYEEKDLVKRISISSILWSEKSKNFKTTDKYKIIYLKQSEKINKEKMDRCAYVNCIQNGDANVMLLTNKNLILEDNKIIVLWVHDCGNVPLVFADLFEISYKMSLIEMVDYYLENETDPIEKEIYCICKKYIENRRERKKWWLKNKITEEIWASTRVIVPDE